MTFFSITSYLRNETKEHLKDYLARVHSHINRILLKKINPVAPPTKSRQFFQKVLCPFASIENMNNVYFEILSYSYLLQFI